MYTLRYTHMYSMSIHTFKRIKICTNTDKYMDMYTQTYIPYIQIHTYANLHAIMHACSLSHARTHTQVLSPKDNLKG